jgi:hypothetical protein
LVRAWLAMTGIADGYIQLPYLKSIVEVAVVQRL